MGLKSKLTLRPGGGGKNLSVNLTLSVQWVGMDGFPWTTGGTLDNWRCSRQMEVLSTTRGTLDNRRYFGQLEVLWRTVGTPDKCPGQLEVLSMTGNPMMLCDHKVQSNPASVRSKFLGRGRGGGWGGVAMKDA